MADKEMDWDENENLLDISTEYSPPSVFVDYERYEHYLDDPDLSEEQKREILQALWTIVCEFVALGFGVHPLQQAQKACGQLPKNRRKAPDTGPDAVDYGGTFLTTDFDEVADLIAEPGAGGFKT